MAMLCHLNSAAPLTSSATSRTILENGSFRSRRSLVDFWYFRISINALVPGQNLFFCLTGVPFCFEGELDIEAWRPPGEDPCPRRPAAALVRTMITSTSN